MYIWTGEVEENWNYMDDGEFEGIDGIRRIGADSFEEAKEKLLFLYPLGNKIENLDYNPKSKDSEFDRKHKFLERLAVNIILLKREDELDA